MIPIALPFLGDQEGEAAREAILSGWVSQGPQVAAFELEFATALGADHACAVSNCTTGLHLALLAVGIKPGDEVITASHSFIATANCIRYCGGIPVFVDIEPDTYNIDPLAVAEAITSRTRAVLAVHQMGMPCDLNALSLIVSARGIPLIEDAACAAGSQIQFRGEWNHIGRPHGDIACFSFHPRKVITTGEGGMLTAKRGDYDREFRLLRQHGMSVPDTVRHGSERVIFEEYVRLGFNYRMTDVQAAIGRIQIQRLAGLVEQRRKLAALYGALLQDVEGLRLPVEKAWARSNWQSYCVGLPESADQSAVMQTLLDKGIATRRGIMCAHREAPYREQQRRHDLRQSERAQDFSILLPIYAQMTEEQVTYVAEALRDSLLARSASRSMSYA
jgi:perosamine synthetase